MLFFQKRHRELLFDLELAARNQFTLIKKARPSREGRSLSLSDLTRQSIHYANGFSVA